MNFTNISSEFSTVEPFTPNWARIVVTVTNCVYFWVGCPGNLLVLMVFLKRQKTTTNWIIITLALVDLVFLLVHTPMYFINIYPALFVNLGTDFFCRLFYCITYLLSTCATILFDFVAIDRFFKTTRPHSQMLTERTSKYVCIGIVLFSTLCATAYLFVASIYASTTCIFGKGLIVDVLSTLRFICSLLSMFLLSGMYFRIFVISYRRRRGRLEPDHLPNKGEPSCEIQRSSLKNRVQPEASISNICSEDVDNHTDDRIDVELREGKRETKTSECVSEPDLKDRIRHTSESDTSSSNVNETNITDVSISVRYYENDDDCQGRGKISRHISTISSVELFSSRARTASKLKTKKALRERKIDSTTKIIFVTFFLFILSTVVPSMAAFLFVRFVSGRGLVFYRVLIFLLSKLSILQTCINPICYFCLSRVFRREMMNMLRKLCSR